MRGNFITQSLDINLILEQYTLGNLDKIYCSKMSNKKDNCIKNVEKVE